MTNEHKTSGSELHTTPSSISVRVYRDLAELEPIAEQWDNLACEACRRPPVTSHAWVSAFLQANGVAEGSWICLAAFEGDRLLGVLPLGKRRDRVLGADVVKLVQPGVPRVNSVDTVISAGRERDVLDAFRVVLDRLYPGWYSLEFNWIDRYSPLVIGDSGCLPRTSVVRHAAGLVSAISTVGNWERYFAGVSQSLRRTIRRSYRKLADTQELQVQMLSGADAHPSYLDRFMKIEASGWKGAAGSALARNPELVEVHRTLCANLYRRGMLEWHFLKTEGEDIAGQFAVRAGRTIYIYRIGYNETYHQYSPGVLMREQTIARAFADPSIDTVNFVTNRPWHRDWRAEQFPIYHVWVFPSRARSIVAGVWPKRVWQGLRLVPGVRAAAAKLRGSVNEGSAIQGRLDFLRLRQRERRRP